VCALHGFIFFRRQIGSLGWTFQAAAAGAESVARPLVAIATRGRAIIVVTGRI